VAEQKSASRVWLQVLGPIQASHAGARPIRLGPPRQRAVLGLLALSANALVHRDELIDGLWADEVPETAVGLVQAYVSRLRRALVPGGTARPGRALIASVGASYRFQAQPGELDLIQFSQAARAAARAARAGDLTAACERYEQALRLWRGWPLADVDLLRASPAVTALRDHRATVAMEYAVVAARAGRHRLALPHLRQLAESEPLDERVHGCLMIALAGSGQQAAALAVYAGLVARLDDQLGVRPGPDLAETHLRVLRQDVGAGPVLGSPAAVELASARVVPRQLPPAIRPFHGRAAELELLAVAAGDAGPAVAAVTGGAGIGKTALVLHWAHLAAEHFPDGQLYLNLRGFDAAEPPLTRARAIRSLLGALSATPGAMPPEFDDQVSLYRSLTAGRRLLVILDNAYDARQVRPLLPGGPGCVTMVTGRARLTGLAAELGACLVHLAALSEDEALGLLRGRLGVGRVAAEPVAARRLARLCAGLPLALGLIAAHAQARPALPLAALAAELADERGRIDLLDAVCPDGGPRTAFAASCGQLRPRAARLLRLLAREPGPDVTAREVADLVGLRVQGAAAALGELAELSLVTEHAPGRFSIPSLLRSYAACPAD
jgi:DNA-binding SARP family transcriptional activator